MKEQKLLKQIRIIIVFFMIMMILSGITASPVESGLAWLLKYKEHYPKSITDFINVAHEAAQTINDKYPFIFYGYDWLVFAHIVIATAFIGPYRDPVKNIWVIEWGMLSCVAVLFLALIVGPMRGIPIYWQLIDCSFGVIGFIPLMFCRKKIKQLAVIRSL
jgi:hypothetical protein